MACHESCDICCSMGFVCASFFLKQNTCIFQTTKPFWLITVATCISVGHLQFDNSVDNFGSSPGHFSTKVLAWFFHRVTAPSFGWCSSYLPSSSRSFCSSSSCCTCATQFSWIFHCMIHITCGYSGYTGQMGLVVRVLAWEARQGATRCQGDSLDLRNAVQQFPIACSILTSLKTTSSQIVGNENSGWTWYRSQLKTTGGFHFMWLWPQDIPKIKSHLII